MVKHLTSNHPTSDLSQRGIITCPQGQDCLLSNGAIFTLLLVYKPTSVGLALLPLIPQSTQTYAVKELNKF